MTMEVARIGIALCLLAAPGLAFVYWITRGTAPGSRALVIGYGLIAGLIIVPLFMRLADFAGASLGFSISATGATAMSIAFLVLGRRRSSVYTHIARPPDADIAHNWNPWTIAIAVLLTVLVAHRILLLAGEIIWTPLYPWDATMHWATKSRVWFEHLELRPFIENTDWLSSRSADAYTDHHPGYPITIPLLQVYVTSALGHWNESLMNLPWLFCYLGLGVAFYAQARGTGASVLLATIFTYFLLSMPLLNTHVALAGYADLFLGSCYCLALMALHRWSQDRQRSQAALTLLFVLACLLVKNEGFFWALTLLPGVIAILLPGKRAPMTFLAILLAACLALVLFPRDVAVAGHSLEQLRIFYREDALEGVLASLFVFDNWHLFGYLLLGLVSVSLVVNRKVFTDCKAITISLLAALPLFLFLFLFTKYSDGAVAQTAVGRISLHLIPAGMFYCLLLAKDLLEVQRATVQTSANTSRADFAAPIEPS